MIASESSDYEIRKAFQRLAEQLEQENANLKDWIRQEGERSDVCTFTILGEICGNCACHRKSQANVTMEAPNA